MYTENELVRVAKRENNTKRGYLVVNQLQAKHIPARPAETFAMFDELAEQLIEAYKDEKLLLVGFAETATAIGARLSVKLDCLYMQTTREDIPDVSYLYFTESHSHATEQKLIKTDLDKMIGLVDRIVFVEDEVTTGNTILKIVEIIKKTYQEKIKFAVACLLNGMDRTSQSVYEERDIALHYLVKTDHSHYTEIANRYEEDGEYITERSQQGMPVMKQFDVGNYKNARRLVQGKEYQDACEKLWQQIDGFVDLKKDESVLVLGTEEFMYPAIYVASKISEKGCYVKSHSTTRSPIAVSKANDYPLHVRYELRSLYDESRRTFIYNLESYDKVLIITDSNSSSNAGICDLCNAVMANGNSEICFIRWYKE